MSQPTVSKYRQQVIKVITSDQPTTVKDKDGKERKRQEEAFNNDPFPTRQKTSCLKSVDLRRPYRSTERAPAIKGGGLKS